MSWFLIAISAHVIWSAVNLADRYLVVRFKASEASTLALVMFTGPRTLVIGSIIVLSHLHLVGSYGVMSMVLLVISGAIQTAGVWCYLEALTKNETSNVVAWFLLMPIFAYILSFFMLGEALTILQLLGIVVIIVGALIFSLEYHAETNRHHIPRSMIVLMVTASLFLVIGDILMKKGSPDSNLFWPALGVTHIGSGFFAMLFFIIPKYRNQFMRMISGTGKALFAINLSSELATIAGSAMKLFAVLIAPVALVTSLEGYQPLIVYIMTIPMAYLAPKYFTIEKGRRHIALKVIGAALLIIGTYLLL